MNYRHDPSIKKQYVILRSAQECQFYGERVVLEY